MQMLEGGGKKYPEMEMEVCWVEDGVLYYLGFFFSCFLFLSANK